MLTINTALIPSSYYTRYEGKIEEVLTTLEGHMYIVPDMCLVPITEDMQVYTRAYIEEHWPEVLV